MIKIELEVSFLPADMTASQFWREKGAWIDVNNIWEALDWWTDDPNTNDKARVIMEFTTWFVYLWSDGRDVKDLFVIEQLRDKAIMSQESWHTFVGDVDEGVYDLLYDWKDDDTFELQLCDHTQCISKFGMFRLDI